MLVLVGEADHANASMIARGTPLSSWLALTGDTSSREAAGIVFAGKDLTRNPTVQEAAVAGQVSVGQARSIVKVLDELPTLDAGQQLAATRHLVAQAGSVEQLMADRVQVIPGDLPDVPELPRDTDVLVHCAGDVSFDPPIDQAFRTNVLGARSLLTRLREACSDENGDLKAEYAQPDGYHLKPEGYTVWVDYLCSHTAG